MRITGKMHIVLSTLLILFSYNIFAGQYDSLKSRAYISDLGNGWYMTVGDPYKYTSFAQPMYFVASPAYVPPQPQLIYCPLPEKIYYVQNPAGEIFIQCLKNETI